MAEQPGTTRRVLIIARLYPAHDNPGRGSFVADQASALVAAGLDVAVLCPVPAPASGLGRREGPARLADFDRLVATVAADLPFATPRGWGAPGVPVLRAPVLLPIGGEPTRHPVDLGELAARSLVPIGLAIAGRWPFDVIHLHNGFPDGEASAELATRLGRPLVVTEHDSTLRSWTSDDRARTAYGRLVQPGSRVVAVSSALAAVAAQMAGTAAGRIEVIPNVVPVDGFPAAQVGGRDPNQLLWVGARKLSKGPETLLRAAALARAGRPSLRLRMIGRPGSDEEEARLRALAAELGLDEVTAFEPATDRAGVAAAMAAAGVFVHPSPWETFGVVAAEAIATGLPVAATPSGGVEDIVGRDGSLGSIAEDVSPAALARAIEEVLARRDRFEPTAMHEAIAGRYAPARVAHLLAEAYASTALERRDPGAGGAAGPGVGAHAAEPTEPAERPAPGSSSTGSGGLPILLGLRRPAALERLRALPPELAGQLTVITLPARPGVAADAARDAAATVTLVEADGEGAYARLVQASGGPVRPAGTLGRLARAIRHPIRTLRLRRLLSAHASIVRGEQQRVIREAAAHPGTAGAPRAVLTLDVDDIAIVGDLIGRELELSPLALPGLVDRWAGGAGTSGRVAP